MRGVYPTGFVLVPVMRFRLLGLGFLSPSEERYSSNHDHRPFAETMKELPSILRILFDRDVRCFRLDFFGFHKYVLPVQLRRFKAE